MREREFFKGEENAGQTLLSAASGPLAAWRLGERTEESTTEDITDFNRLIKTWHTTRRYNATHKEERKEKRIQKAKQAGSLRYGGEGEYVPQASCLPK